MTGQAWNDERVARLKKLWAEGLSASQISFRLGGVTRNAVIGKVSRLGLTKRKSMTRKLAPRPPRSSYPRCNAGLPSPAQGQAASALPPPEAAPGSPSFSRFNFRGTERSAVELVEVPILEDDPAPEARIQVLQLKEHHCRWPIGQPGEAGYGACGRQPLKGQPYCEKHSRMAHAPVQARQRERRLA
jgi:GcrA cell cycle regulator